MTVLRDLSQDQLIALVQALQAKQGNSNNGIKVFGLGEKNKDGIPYKGTLGVRTGRNYTILYASQWLDVLDKADAIREAIEANRDRLSWKGDLVGE